MKDSRPSEPSRYSCKPPLCTKILLNPVHPISRQVRLYDLEAFRRTGKNVSMPFLSDARSWEGQRDTRQPAVEHTSYQTSANGKRSDLERELPHTITNSPEQLEGRPLEAAFTHISHDRGRAFSNGAERPYTAIRNGMTRTRSKSFRIQFTDEQREYIPNADSLAGWAHSYQRRSQSFRTSITIVGKQ
ncbi:hypothetical protein NA57DRAFT_55238 [Rhizodiscina lignyota]|uniref:Uncharacterized protein n=1 Tax=Rhizodiscina lignyota TaxID=1504668 RepID=A0A9P4IGL8_9PEZI|nr:hypothetical protein NA57DRAFT_55238 [Rhizodiscina lignyota]